MSPTSMAIENRRQAIAQWMLSRSKRSPLQYHFMCLLAGWADLFSVLPAAPGRPVTGKAILGGALALVLLFCLVLGPVLRVLQPVFQALGQCPGWGLVSILFLTLNAWRYGVGRSKLRHLAAGF